MARTRSAHGRPLAALVATLAVVVAVGGACGSAAEPAPLHLAYGAPVVITIPLWAAADGGFFARYGFAASPPQLIGGPTAIAALTSGEVDLVSVGGYATALAVGAGASIRMVAAANAIEPFVIYARKKIPSPRELAGLRVATSGAASESQIAFTLYLKKVGLPPDTVIYLNAGNSANQFAALVSGAADVNPQIPPIPPAVARTLYVFEDMRQDRIPWITTGFDVSATLLQREPDRVMRIVQALEEGARYALDHRDFTMRLVRKYMQMTDPAQQAEAYTIYREILAPDLIPSRAAIDGVLEQARAIRKDLNAEAAQQFFSTSVLDALRANGFLTQHGAHQR